MLEKKAFVHLQLTEIKCISISASCIHHHGLFYQHLTVLINVTNVE